MQFSVLRRVPRLDPSWDQSLLMSATCQMTEELKVIGESEYLHSTMVHDKIPQAQYTVCKQTRGSSPSPLGAVAVCRTPRSRLASSPTTRGACTCSHLLTSRYYSSAPNRGRLAGQPSLREVTYSHSPCRLLAMGTYG